MKRRRFMQAMAAAPAVPVLIAQQAPSGRGPRGGGAVAQGPALIDVTQPDAVGETVARFFTPAQFSALKKLSEAFMPASNANPGALECEAPEFLDFLIGVSPANRKQLYRGGLDALNARATAKFAKPFADLDAKQLDEVIRPLLVATPWVLDRPKDPVMRFIAAARTDIPLATRNSRTWATSGRAAASPLMWLPIDPIYKG